MSLNKAPIWITALLVLGGCPGPDKKLSAVSVRCEPTSVVDGQPSQCTASATAEDGTPFTVPAGYTWTSSNESVATVDSTGKVTTLTPGTVAISASATAAGVTQQGQATLTVTPQSPRLSAVTVTCEPTPVPATRPAQCTASATDQYGKPFSISSYTWTSSNESVATVNSTGKVTTFTTGTAAISASATSEGVTQQGQVSLSVTEAQPTLHSTPITANETWSEANNPHVVQGSLEVGGASAPTLTLSAGTVVRFGSGAELRVGQTNPGALIVDGTAASPVLFTADSTNPQPGHWQGVHIVHYDSSPSRISHATIEFAGAGGTDSLGAGNLNLYGEFIELGAGTRLEHVVLRKSSQHGLVLETGGNIGSGSTGLIVSENGGYAISGRGSYIGTIPTDTTISDNERDAVAVHPNLWSSQTWPKLGVPYVITDFVEVGASLTLQPGTELRFSPGASLLIGPPGFPGALSAMGTAQEPIRFVPDTATPTKGYWNGLHFWYASGSQLDHVLVTHAGAASPYLMGNVNVHREIGAFLTNSTLSDSSQCGLIRSNGSRTNTTEVTTDFTLATYNNTFVDNDGGAQCSN